MLALVAVNLLVIIGNVIVILDWTYQHTCIDLSTWLSCHHHTWPESGHTSHVINTLVLISLFLSVLICLPS